METHPVPKNVLDIEFKLFGPLTVKQFVQIFAACIASLGLFLVEINFLIKAPLIAVVLFLGVMTALVEGFDVKVKGLIRAIFTNTQYVWRNQHDVPEILQQESEAEKKRRKKERQEEAVEEFSELTIDKLLDARKNYRLDSALVTEQPNQTQPQKDERTNDFFEQVYRQEFQDRSEVSLKESNTDRAPKVERVQGLAGSGDPGIAMGNKTRATVKPVVNNAPRAEVKVNSQVKQQVAENNRSQAEIAVEMRELTAEINQLKTTLSSTDTQERRRITQDIKQKFNRLQDLAAQTSVKESGQQTAQNLFGVVLAKEEQPVPGASVGILNQGEQQQIVVQTKTQADGKFNLEIPEGLNDFVVRIVHPQFDFPDYKIDNSKQLPAYKFVAKDNQ